MVLFTLVPADFATVASFPVFGRTGAQFPIQCGTDSVAAVLEMTVALLAPLAGVSVVHRRLNQRQLLERAEACRTEVVTTQTHVLSQ